MKYEDFCKRIGENKDALYAKSSEICELVKALDRRCKKSSFNFVSEQVFFLVNYLLHKIDEMEIDIDELTGRNTDLMWKLYGEKEGDAGYGISEVSLLQEADSQSKQCGNTEEESVL